MPKKMVTKRRQAWGQQQQASQFKGLALAYPVAVEGRYRASMESLIDGMLAEYDAALRRLYRGNPEITQDESVTTQARRILAELGRKWSKAFAEKAGPLANRTIGQVDRFSKQNLGASLRDMSGGLTIKTFQMPAGLYDKVLASTAENVGLIKSIPVQFQDRIQGIVMRSIQSGGQGSGQIFDEIKNLNQVTRNRAKLIAVDQTRKITSAMNEERMKAAGVKQFEWIHSGGGAEPRSLHVQYDGQTFSMDNPPIIDKRTGQHGFPGELINCRCRMRPVIDFTEYLDEQATN
ncbi:minor capsid protein [Achromobacter sp. ACRQX]|uniref:phage head morphogenesis protein n=1 Tax=Achromobacter sp. ACRQX TaxID=2918181 RepID=UPI001EF37AA5|nr:minor capsid protein [Achromobacter sp. ACRQX]MCG7324291.1 minor capsid protein [Achromobacter sp. ACRQX]